MRNIFILGAAFLGGCASITNPIKSAEIYNLENAYGVVQSLAAGYASEPFCPKGTSIKDSIFKSCSIPSGVVQIGKADASARTALAVAENFVRANPRLSAASVISAAQSAIAAATQIEADYGLHK